jgi:hypothetical protein
MKYQNDYVHWSDKAENEVIFLRSIHLGKIQDVDLLNFRTQSLHV